MSGLERPDTQESLRKMKESFEDDRKPMAKKLLNFQVFASTLLITLVIITGTAFSFAMTSEREAREQNEARRALFENYVVDILSSIEDMQERDTEDRSEMVELIERVESILQEHVEDGRIDNS